MMKTLSILAPLTLLGSAFGARYAYDDADGLFGRDAGSIDDVPGLYARRAVPAEQPLSGLRKRDNVLRTRSAYEPGFGPTLNRRDATLTDTAAFGGPSPRLDKRDPFFMRHASKHYDRMDSRGSE